MGDPETEVVMPRLKNDLVELLTAVAKGEIDRVTVEKDERFALTIMAVSGGYPGDYLKGYEIAGMNQPLKDSLLFHAGTQLENGKVVTSGGRVLAVTSFGKTVAGCAAKSLGVLEQIEFRDMYYRNDIGYEFAEE
jgi:phosphoribosylamine--glycine ligase